MFTPILSIDCIFQDNKDITFDPLQCASPNIVHQEDVKSVMPVGLELEVVVGDYCIQCDFCGNLALKPDLITCNCIICQVCKENILPESTCKAHQQNVSQYKQFDELHQIQYNQTIVKCPYNQNGCEQLIQLQDFISHCDQCIFSVLKCPYCKTPQSRQQFQEHLNNCIYLPCLCKICNIQLPVSNVLLHMEEQHPICTSCNSRKFDLNDSRHTSQKCLCQDCNEYITNCSISLHLTDLKFINQHYEYLIQRENDVDMQLLYINEQSKQLEQQLSNQHQNKNALSQLEQLLTQTTQDICKKEHFLGDFSQLNQVYKYLSVQDKVLTIKGILEILIQNISENNYLVIPEFITLSLMQYHIQFVKADLVDISVAQKFNYQFTEDINYWQLSSQFLIQILVKLLGYSDSKQTMQKIDIIFDDVLQQIISNLRQIQYECVDDYVKELKIQLFFINIIFQEFINRQLDYDQLLDSQLNVNQLEQFLSYKFLTSSTNDFPDDQTQNNNWLYEYYNLDHTILKYTLIDGQLYSESTEELKFYDFVFQIDLQQFSNLTSKIFAFLQRQVKQNFYPRVLVIVKNQQNVQQLMNIINLIPICTYSIEIQLKSQINIGFIQKIDLIFSKIQDHVQNVLITSDKYECNDIISNESFVQLQDCTALKKLKIKNVSLQNLAVKLFNNLIQLQQLILKNVRLQPFYYFTINSQILVLKLHLNTDHSYKRVFESQINQLLNQLSKIHCLTKFQLVFDDYIQLRQSNQDTLLTIVKNNNKLNKVVFNMLNFKDVSLCQKELYQINFCDWKTKNGNTYYQKVMNE